MIALIRYNQDPKFPLTIITGIFFLSGCAAYFDTSPKPELSAKVVQRLKSEEKLPLAMLSKSTPQTLNAALAEQDVRYKKLNLSLPLSNLSQTPAKPLETNRQLSIAEARAMGLSNNLDLKIALIEPSIAATYVSEEQAKFDDLIFANVKYTNKDTPKLDSDVVSFTSMNEDSPLNNEVASTRILCKRVFKSTIFF
jgi:hypothetical protein